MSTLGTASALVRASHPVPCVAVTLIAVLLAASAGAPAGRVGLLGGAVLSGQLTIGWSNDLLDAARDRASSRADKPLARGEVQPAVVRRAVGCAAAACVVLSLACGYAAALLHLTLVVASGWAYNLGLKSTVWSWLPYAVAFGALPAVAWAAAGGSAGSGSGAVVPAGVWWLPPWWALLAGALLGVGAHLLNALPDLADDALTGVRGLPQRLGGRATRGLAPLLLLAGSALVALAPAGPVPAGAGVGLALCTVLAAVAWTGRGRAPFFAAVALALANVAMLVASGA